MAVQSMPQSGPLSDHLTRRSRLRRRRPDLDRNARRYFIYWLYDDTGTCLYVGRSCDVATRLRVHLADTDWAAGVRSLDLRGPYTWDEAVAAERVAIQDEQPPHNRQLTEEWTKQRYPVRVRGR